MSDNKKISAAIAAVTHYIHEEEALQMQAAMYSMPQVSSASAVIQTADIKPWGMSGRQAQMQLRNLMQMRTFQRNRSV